MDYLRLPEVFLSLLLLTPLFYVLSHFLWGTQPLLAIASPSLPSSISIESNHACALPHPTDR